MQPFPVVGLFVAAPHQSCKRARPSLSSLIQDPVCESAKGSIPDIQGRAEFACFVPCVGLVWPRLNLGAATSRIAFWLLVYSGAGNETMRLAAADAHGSAFQKTAIRVVAYSSAPTGLISFALILWGLRIVNNTALEWIAEAPYRNHHRSIDRKESIPEPIRQCGRNVRKVP